MIYDDILNEVALSSTVKDSQLKFDGYCFALVDLEFEEVCHLVYLDDLGVKLEFEGTEDEIEELELTEGLPDFTEMEIFEIMGDNTAAFQVYKNMYRAAKESKNTMRLMVGYILGRRFFEIP